MRLNYPIRNDYLDDGTKLQKTNMRNSSETKLLTQPITRGTWISKFHLTCTQPCQLVEVGVFESYPSVQRQRFTSRHAWGKRLAWCPVSCLLPMSTDQKRWENISNIPILFKCNSLVGFYNVVQSYDLIYVNSLSFFSQKCAFNVDHWSISKPLWWVKPLNCKHNTIPAASFLLVKETSTLWQMSWSLIMVQDDPFWQKGCEGWLQL